MAKQQQNTCNIITKIDSLKSLIEDLYRLENPLLDQRIDQLIKSLEDIKDTDLKNIVETDNLKKTENLQILNKEVYGKFLNRLISEKSTESRKFLLKLFQHITEDNINNIANKGILNDLEKMVIFPENHSHIKPTLTRKITNLKELPEKDINVTRIISYNIAADFFDNKDDTPDGRHKWQFRAPFVKHLLKKVAADIFCLQELSPNQAVNLYKEFSSSYNSFFLCQTSSEVLAGEIARNEQIINWLGKNVGTPLVAILVKHEWIVKDYSCFWLNENPDSIPVNTDRGATDKGFGNMNTYRAILWLKIENDSQKSFYVFNSHYPLSGDSRTRQECAKLEMSKIKQITNDKTWISAGDRNLIPHKNDNERCNPDTIYGEFSKYGYDIRDSGKHFGISTSWIGFSHDIYKNQLIKKNSDVEFEQSTILDIIFANIQAQCSFNLHGAFDSLSLELLDFNNPLDLKMNDIRSFASDHALIGADFDMYI